MKFYTGELDARIQREGFYGEFRPDPRAAALDEALYRELYEAGVARYFDEMRSEYDESLAELRAESAEEGGPSWRDLPEPPAMDEARAVFEEDQEHRAAWLREVLPEHLYRSAADPRVLALDVVAPEVLSHIVAWGEEQDRYLKALMDVAEAYCEKARARVPAELLDALRLHDRKVARAIRTADSLTLYFDRDKVLPEPRALSFAGVDFIAYENPEGRTWLYDEIELLSDGRYSFGASFFDWDKRNSIEIDLYARDVRAFSLRDSAEIPPARAGEEIAEIPAPARGSCLKFFTWEMCELLQRTHLEHFLQPDPRAVVGDEALFQEVYGQKRKAYTDRERRSREMTLEEWAEERDPSWPPFSAEDIARRKHLLEPLYRAIQQKPPFDEAKENAEFDRRLAGSMARNRRLWPEHLYRLVADPRLVALDVATPEVIARIKAWSGEQERYSNAVWDAGMRYSGEVEESVPGRIRGAFSLHDEKIERADKTEDSLTLVFASEQAQYRPATLRFVGCSFVKYEDLTGKYWGYEELERLSDGWYSVGITTGHPGNYREIMLYAREIIIEG